LPPLTKKQKAEPLKKKSPLLWAGKKLPLREVKKFVLVFEGLTKSEANGLMYN